MNETSKAIFLCYAAEFMKSSFTLCVWFICLGIGRAFAADNYDPVTQDPRSIDATNPPATASFKIPSGGTTINATIYLANGAGPHATVLFLHGRPGNERNFDVAQALRRAGYHVLTMNHRGSWGSGGLYSFRNAVADAHAALAFLRSPEAGSRYRVDASRLLIFGHSLGGYVALQAAARDREVRGVAALAPVNMNHTVEALRSPEQRSAILQRYRPDIDPDSGPLRVESLEAMVAFDDGYDFLQELAGVPPRPVLLMAGKRDSVLPLAQHHEPIERALRTTGAKRVDVVIFDDDHAFSATRIALTRAVVDWCRKTVAP